MTLQIDLPAELTARLEAQAANLGIAPAAYARKLIEDSLLTPAKSNGSLADLFARWAAEDPTDDPAEIERRTREGEELMQNLARNRIEMEGPNARKLWP